MRPGKFLFYATMEQVESKLTHLIHQETLLQELYMQVRLHLIFPTLNKSNKEDMADRSVNTIFATFVDSEIKILTDFMLEMIDVWSWSLHGNPIKHNGVIGEQFLRNRAWKDCVTEVLFRTRLYQIWEINFKRIERQKTPIYSRCPNNCHLCNFSCGGRTRCGCEYLSLYIRVLSSHEFVHCFW